MVCGVFKNVKIGLLGLAGWSHNPQKKKTKREEEEQPTTPPPYTLPIIINTKEVGSMIPNKEKKE